MLLCVFCCCWSLWVPHQAINYASLFHLNIFVCFLLKFLTVASVITQMDFNLSSLRPPSSYQQGLFFAVFSLFDEKTHKCSALKHKSICLNCSFVFSFSCLTPRKHFPAVWNSSSLSPSHFKIMHPTSQMTNTCHVAALCQPQQQHHHDKWYSYQHR